MFLLKKAFQLRDKANPDNEKPFLEHLEDLRLTLTRMTLVLLVTTIACFIFRNDLMDIIKKPVADLYESRLSESLKDVGVKLDNTTWETATKAARDASAAVPCLAAAVPMAAAAGHLGQRIYFCASTSPAPAASMRTTAPWRAR